MVAIIYKTKKVLHTNARKQGIAYRKGIVAPDAVCDCYMKRTVEAFSV